MPHVGAGGGSARGGRGKKHRGAETSPTVGAMQVELNYGPEGQRLVNMAHAAVGDVLDNYVADFPNYGDGSAYWSINANDNGTLPLITIDTCHALLKWGLVEQASSKLAFYMNTWVNATTGFIQQAGGGWMYNCPLGFPDGLSDFGRMLHLWVATARANSDCCSGPWIADNLPRVLSLANYTLKMRQNATANTAGVVKGLIWGPAEHDTCHSPDYYFSTSMWTWRGMLEFGRWLAEHAEDSSMRSGSASAAAAAAAVDYAAFANKLLAEAALFAVDVRRAFGKSIVRNATTGQPFFVPPIAGSNQTAFRSMVESTAASYSNFRYFSEMLSSGFMTHDEAMLLSTFRETHHGTLSGMTRYTDHLDDMPAVGYAASTAMLDRVTTFNLLLFGHIANYQSHGTYHATEQLSLYGSAPSNFREYYTMAEYDIDFCVPAALLIAHMLKLALTWEDFDETATGVANMQKSTLHSAEPGPSAGRGPATVWVLKMAPRRWYRSKTPNETAVDVKGSPSSLGPLGFVVESAQTSETNAADMTIKATVSIADWTARSVRYGGTIKVRLRDPTGDVRRLVSVRPEPSCGSTTVVVDAGNQTVDILVASSAEALLNCSFVALLK